MGDRPDARLSRHAAANWPGRLATEADAEAILELLVAAFGTWPSRELTVPALEHLRWKLLGRDDVRHCQVVMEHGNRIIGLNAVFRQRILMRGKLRSSYQFVDLAVLPEYQHQGVIPAARRFAASAGVRYGDLLFGPPRVDPRAASRATEKKDSALRNNAYLQALVLEGQVRAPPPRQSSWLARTPARFDSRVRAFWEEASRPFDLISAHDEEFLNWRYCDPRAGRWTVHTAEEGGRLLGYVTYRISNNRAYIGGLLALPDRLDVVEGLIVEMMRSLHRQGVSAVQCWSTSSHPYRGVLRDLHVDQKRRYVRVTVHADNEDLSGLAAPTARVHMAAGDTDLA